MKNQLHNQLDATSRDAYTNVQAKNTNMRSRRPNLLREIMRPHGSKTIGEIDIPSLDLGISTQQCIEQCHDDVESSSLTRNKHRTRSESQQCTDVVISERVLNYPTTSWTMDSCSVKKT
ncbi:hypothetical protein Adt_34579 [Abeliophyllum distichum]|uniref:Uncharacterized protein n=1 Tax=Abeliophyllum distichum TaxID=126358 RepID=A0ABD1R1H1_9LAMI